MSQLALGPCPGEKAARQVKCGPVVRKGNEMKLPILIFTIFLFGLGGCSPGVSRYGYTIKEDQKVEDCPMPFKLKFSITDTKKLGNIEVYDHNLISSNCDIFTVLSILKRDGCYLGADLINITEEKYPDYIWSVCYRVKADFIKIDKGETKGLESDPQYDLAKLKQEGEASRKRGNAAYINAVGAGLVGGAVGGAMGGGR